MALVARLCGRQASLLRQDRQILAPFNRAIVIQKIEKPREDEDHDARALRLRRPQSPHLSIYAVQLTSTLSISHRFAGLALAGYATCLGAGAVVLPDSIPHYIDAWNASNPNGALLVMLKGALALPLSYHYWNGVRHLVWDAAKLMKLNEIYLTGYVVLGLTAASTGVLMSL